MPDRTLSTSAVTPQNSAFHLVDARDVERCWPPAVVNHLRDAALSRAKGQVLGDGPRWHGAIERLRQYGPNPLSFDRSVAVVGATSAPRDDVEQALRELCPWRKGPFEVLGVHLDAEWRCDMKWDRVRRAVTFEGKRVLDVGCGNGYYLLRALGAGAEAALGVDPTWLYVAQFAAIWAALAGADTLAPRPLPAWVLPLGIEDVAGTALRADVVLSMGVLYHRKSPLEHLEQLRSALEPGGTLVLESLVVPGGEHTVLVPESRYAQMRNVWMIPSVDGLVRWCKRMGFTDVELADVSTTSSDEQRPSVFMNSLSLADFLDPNDSQLTVEGYPRPRRAIVVARR